MNFGAYDAYVLIVELSEKEKVIGEALN